MFGDRTGAPYAPRSLFRSSAIRKSTLRRGVWIGSEVQAPTARANVARLASKMGFFTGTLSFCDGPPAVDRGAKLFEDIRPLRGTILLLSRIGQDVVQLRFESHPVRH